MITEHRNFVLINVYAPNAGDSLQRPRLEFKMRWFDALRQKITALTMKGKQVVLVGDLNIPRSRSDVSMELAWDGLYTIEVRMQSPCKLHLDDQNNTLDAMACEAHMLCAAVAGYLSSVSSLIRLIFSPSPSAVRPLPCWCASPQSRRVGPDRISGTGHFFRSADPSDSPHTAP